METLIIQVICQLESKFHFSYIWILHLVFAASFLYCSDEERMIAISSEDYWGIMIFAGVIFLNTAQNMYILLCLWWYGMYITHCLYTQFDQRNSFSSFGSVWYFWGSLFLIVMFCCSYLKMPNRKLLTARSMWNCSEVVNTFITIHQIKQLEIDLWEKRKTR